MESEQPVFYLRQALSANRRFTTLSASAREVTLIAHFYVSAEDGTQAGGVAGTFSVANELECVEYICLPQVIAPGQIAEHETEHLEAFQLASKEGFAVVMSVVLAEKP